MAPVKSVWGHGQIFKSADFAPLCRNNQGYWCSIMFKRADSIVGFTDDILFEDGAQSRQTFLAHAKAGAEPVPHPRSRKAGSGIRHRVW
jgi:hypothetical protein